MKRIVCSIFPLILAASPFAAGVDAQSIVDFRQAVRTAEPSLMTVLVSPEAPVELPANRQDEDDVDPPEGPRIQWLDLTGKPIAQPPFQAGAGPQELTSAAFAVDESIIVAYVGDPALTVTIRDADGEETQGDVIAMDYVTGIAAIKVQNDSYPPLVVSAAQTEPGMPVIAAWLDDLVLTTDAGMVSTRPFASGSGVGFTPKIDFGSGRGMLGAPVLDSDSLVVGMLVPDRNGELVCVESSSILRLVDLATGDKPRDLKRGMVGIQFQGGGPLVMEVSDDSGASEAGIKAGDLVKQVDGIEIRDATDVVAAVASARAGDTIEVVVSRGEQLLTIPVRLTEHPQQRLAAWRQPGTGMTIQNGFGFQDGRRIPMEINPFAPGMGNFPMNEFFRQFQQPQGPQWRFENPGAEGPIDGSPLQRSDVEETLKDLQRQMERLNQKLDQPQ
jgi:serine protease Do